MERKSRVQLSAIAPPSSPIYTSLHRPSDNMGLRDGLRDFLCIPKHRRTPSKARSDIGSTEGPNEADLAVPRSTESTPDLRIGASTLPTSGPPTPRDQESSGTRTDLSRKTNLTNSSHDTANPVVSEHTQSVPGESKHLESSDLVPDQSAAVENKSNWKSTAYSSAKVVIDVVKESSDVFPPLKAAVGGLTAILKHYDVWSVSPTPFTMLKIAPANDGQSENDRIVDTPD